MVLKQMFDLDNNNWIRMSKKSVSYSFGISKK